MWWACGQQENIEFNFFSQRDASKSQPAEGGVHAGLFTRSDYCCSDAPL